MRAGGVLLLHLLLAGCAAATGPELRSLLTPQVLAAVPGPLLFFEAPALGAGGVVQPAGENGGVVTWRSQDGVSLSLDHGLLVATRGLGFDLMSADLGGTARALAGGDRTDYPRLHSYLDGENRTRFRAFRCRMTPAGGETVDVFGTRHAVTRLDETCYSTTDPISNTYWVGGDGTIWQSRQWVSEELGPVAIELIRP